MTIDDADEARLTTWKEIAAFLGRDERTAKRWELSRGLPIHRVPGGRSTVFAYRRELAVWLSQAPDEPYVEAPGDVEPPEQEPAAVRRRRPIALPLALTAAAVLTGAAFWLVAGVAGHGPTQSQPPPDLYTRAIYLMNTRTRSGLNEAITDFSRVIVEHPRYAPAYAGLADCYNLMPEFGGLPPAQAFAQAKVAAVRAVELDPRSAEAQRALGFVQFWGFHDVPAAQRAFRQALKLEPNSAETHHWYGNLLTMVGDTRQALAEFAAAERLDSNSTSIRADSANTLMSAGHLDEAGGLLRSIVAAEPNYAPAELYLGRVLAARGDHQGAWKATLTAAHLGNDAAEESVAQAALDGLGAGGPAEMHRQALARQEALYRANGYPAYRLAESLAADDPSRAVDLLEVSEKAGDPWIMGARADTALAPLHGAPRFIALLKRLGLPSLPVTRR